MNDELDPDLVYDAIVRALLAGTALRNVDDLGDTTTPGVLLHRSFRIEPGAMKGFGKARPGDVTMIEQRFAVVISHEIDPNARRASLSLASSDLRLAMCALLTRTELSGLGQPLFGGVTARTTGHQREQTMSLDVQYHIALPEAAGPE